MANNQRAGGASADESVAAQTAMRGALGLSVLLLATLQGCQSRPPDVAAGQAIGASLDVPDVIALRIEGGPIDELAGATAALTLAEAMRCAVTTDASIQSALARVRIALADADQARLLPNPVLNLALRWPESGVSPIVEASLAQDFLAILTAPRKANAADNRLRQAAADAVTVALDVASELQERYATTQALDELLPVLEQRRELLDRLVGLAQSRLDAGEGRRQDVTVLQAQRVELDVEIASTEQERRDERLRLARLIGEPSSAATWTLEPWSAPQRVDASEMVWVEAGLTHRPEIQSIAWQLAALGDDLALTRLLSFEGSSAGVSAEDDDGWSIGPEVSAPLPIFDLGQAREDRVRAEQIEARHELTRTRRIVVEDVRRAYQAFDQTSANLRRVRDELIPLQEQRRSMAEAAFHSERDITSLILAEQDLRNAHAQAVDLERQMTIALIRLHRAVGGAGVAKQVAAVAPARTHELDDPASSHPGDSTSPARAATQEDH
jgi:outer membrane protein TolC